MALRVNSNCEFGPAIVQRRRLLGLFRHVPNPVQGSVLMPPGGFCRANQFLQGPDYVSSFGVCFGSRASGSDGFVRPDVPREIDDKDDDKRPLRPEDIENMDIPQMDSFARAELMRPLVQGRSALEKVSNFTNNARQQGEAASAQQKSQKKTQKNKLFGIFGF